MLTLNPNTVIAEVAAASESLKLGSENVEPKGHHQTQIQPNLLQAIWLHQLQEQSKRNECRSSWGTITSGHTNDSSPTGRKPGGVR
jgi:hypothetical protein